MIERRNEPRRRSLLGATVIFGRRQCTMDCLVRNISPHGALVVFPQSAIIPNDIQIHIPQRERVFSAKVAWRRHDRAGLALSEPTEARTPPHS